MKNTNYYAEMIEANKYLEEHKNDTLLHLMFESFRDSGETLSEKRERIYNFLSYHDPYIKNIDCIVTGLTYLSEN